MLRWIADLESDQFAVRQKATESLEKQRDLAETALLAKLSEKPSLEVRQRIERLLNRIRLGPETLQELRAVEVLWSASALPRRKSCWRRWRPGPKVPG